MARSQPPLNVQAVLDFRISAPALGDMACAWDSARARFARLRACRWGAHTIRLTRTPNRIHQPTAADDP